MNPSLPNILIVDDLPANLSVMKKILAKVAANMFEAMSGADSLALCAEHDFALLLLDVNMPQMSGFQVAEILHGVQRTRALPIIFVTAAEGDAYQTLKGYQVGAVDFIHKPVDPQILLFKVNVFLELYNQKKQLQEKNSELERLQNILLLMMDALFMVSPEGIIQSVNQPTLFGYSSDELVGQALGSLFVGEAAPFRGTPLKALLDVGSIGHTEVTLLAKSGDRIPVLISGSAVHDAAGQVTSLVLVVKEITDYKKAQQELREKEAQLVHTGRLTAMGEMATGIAHELNQPLTVIRIWAQSLGQDVARKAVADERVRHASREITQQIDRAVAIISHMGIFARVDTQAHPEPMDPAVPASDALMFFREQFRIHEINLDVQLETNLPRIRMHANRFEQIVVNLLSNARYAVDKKGENSPTFQKMITLRLFTGSRDGAAVLEVEDNGIGMSPKEQARCLEPFFTTKEVGRGTGLGLHIVQGIVNEADGAIQVEGRPGQGALLRVTFPDTEILANRADACVEQEPTKE